MDSMGEKHTGRAHRAGRGMALFVAGGLTATGLGALAIANAGTEPAAAPAAQATAAESGQTGTADVSSLMGMMGMGESGTAADALKNFSMKGLLTGSGPVLHGEAVVKDRNGELVTMEFHSGTVTAASGSSVSVRSEDGFERTYTVAADTKVKRNMQDVSAGALASGDSVRVLAQAGGQNPTALGVFAMTDDWATRTEQRLEELREQFSGQMQMYGQMFGDSLQGLIDQWDQSGTGSAGA